MKEQASAIMLPLSGAVSVCSVDLTCADDFVQQLFTVLVKHRRRTQLLPSGDQNGHVQLAVLCMRQKVTGVVTGAAFPDRWVTSADRWVTSAAFPDSAADRSCPCSPLLQLACRGKQPCLRKWALECSTV